MDQLATSVDLSDYFSQTISDSLLHFRAGGLSERQYLSLPSDFRADVKACAVGDLNDKSVRRDKWSLVGTTVETIGYNIGEFAKQLYEQQSLSQVESYVESRSAKLSEVLVGRISNSAHSAKDLQELALEKFWKEYSNNDISIGVFFGLSMIVDEMVSNHFVHGVKSDPRKLVDIKVEAQDLELTIVATNQGIGFDVEALPDPTSAEYLLEVGGRGLLLINSYAEEVSYFNAGTGPNTGEKVVWSVEVAVQKYLTDRVKPRLREAFRGALIELGYPLKK